MAVKEYNVPLPVKGLNSTGAVTDPEYATNLLNFIVTPTELRRRNGVIGKATWRNIGPWTTGMALDTNGRPVTVGHVVFNNEVIIGYTGSITTFEYLHQWSGPPTGYQAQGTYYLMGSTDGSGDGGTAYIDVSAAAIPNAGLVHYNMLSQALTDIAAEGATTRSSVLPMVSAKTRDFSVFTNYGLSNGYKLGGGLAPGQGVLCWAGNRDVYPGKYSRTLNATWNVGTANNTVTISSSIPESVIGCFLHIEISGTEDPQYIFPYLIVDQSGTTLTLDAGYGRGLTAASATTLTNKAAGTTVYISRWGTLGNFGTISGAGGYGRGVMSGCVKLHRDRLFVSGLYYSSTNFTAAQTPPSLKRDTVYRNAISWSLPSDPYHFPISQFTLIDDQFDNAISGLATVGGQLVIFRKEDTYVLHGTDESNFQLQKISSDYGCLDPRSITEYRDGCFFLSFEGWIYLDSNFEFKNICDGPEPGARCVTEHVKNRVNDNWPIMNATSTVLNDTYFICSIMPGPAGNSDPSVPSNLGLVLHIPTQTWSRYNLSTQMDNWIGGGPNRMDSLFSHHIDIGNARSWKYALTGRDIYYIGDMYSSFDSGDWTDRLYKDKDTTPTYCPIQYEWQTPILTPADWSEFKIVDGYIQHSILYQDDNPRTDMVKYTVQFGHDPDYGLGAEFPRYTHIAPRRVLSNQPNPTKLYPSSTMYPSSNLFGFPNNQPPGWWVFANDPNVWRATYTDRLNFTDVVAQNKMTPTPTYIRGVFSGINFKIYQSDWWYGATWPYVTNAGREDILKIPRYNTIYGIKLLVEPTSQGRNEPDAPIT